MMFDIAAFVRERDEALRSLDRERIEAYMEKYHANFRPSSDLVFWAAVHKARLGITGFTPQEKAFSSDWLEKHGFRAEEPY